VNVLKRREGGNERGELVMLVMVLRWRKGAERIF
jgi:hypothetical protein